MDHNEQVDLDITTGDDVLEEGGGSTGCATGSSSVAQKSSASADLNAIWNELMSMKEVVENEHDRKLRRIESDLRWTMTLVGAQFITIIGSAIAMLAGG